MTLLDAYNTRGCCVTSGLGITRAMIAFLTIVTIISIVTTWQRFLFVQADSFSIMLTVSAPSSLLFAGGSEHDSAHQVCAKAAFPNDFSKEVTKRGSYCSVIEELGQDGDPTRTDQPNQIPLLSSAAFFTQKPLMSDETYECEAPGGVRSFRSLPHFYTRDFQSVAYLKNLCSLTRTFKHIVNIKAVPPSSPMALLTPVSSSHEAHLML